VGLRARLRRSRFDDSPARNPRRLRPTAGVCRKHQYISTARPGQQYYDAEATIDLGAIARATLNDDEWELMTVAEGTALEASARSDD
jgi:hypothetical protein